jgi:FlgD Ig-like domain
MRVLNIAALLAPFVILGWPGNAPAGDVTSRTRTDIRVSPGRVVFTMTPGGEWTSFGFRGEPRLLAAGGVIVYTANDAGALDELANSSRGGMKSLLPPGGIAPVQEGAPGGARYPSLRPDDDGDGRVDEDPLDRIDNDHDGRVDEDFAAIGDQMVVTQYGPTSDAPIVIHQEVYAWSLAHIDAMVASAITVRNSGRSPLAGVRVGITLTPSSDLETGRMLARTTSRRAGDLTGTQVVIDGRVAGLALLAFVPNHGRDIAWDTDDDGTRIITVSPDLGTIEPGAAVTIMCGLVALPADDARAARAIQAAQRTILGDGKARMLPPPIPMTAKMDSGLEFSAETSAPPNGSPALDAYWLTPGKLDDMLLGGSPNPFRDAIAIDYEVPSRVVEDDGVEHTLVDAAVPTSVKIYNVTGRLVATLVESVHAPGHYRTGWSAQTNEGATVASGVYYVKLQIGKRSVTKRLVQLK